MLTFFRLVQINLIAVKGGDGPASGVSLLPLLVPLIVATMYDGGCVMFDVAVNIFQRGQCQR